MVENSLLIKHELKSKEKIGLGSCPIHRMVASKFNVKDTLKNIPYIYSMLSTCIGSDTLIIYNPVVQIPPIQFVHN